MKTANFFKTWFLLAAAIMLIGGSFQQAEAQYFAFGKNRVQYKNFNWRYIQSKHFDIYYYQDKNYELANFAAYSLESALKQLRQDIDHKINDRIQVVVYDSHSDFAQTNVVNLPVNSEGIGGVTEPFKNRITIPFSGNYASFMSTLHHELHHAFLNDMFYGGNVQSRISGRGVDIPLWFNEGMSEYSSLGWETNTDMYMRDAIINDYLPPLPSLNGYFAYRGGEAFWNYIVNTYGRQKIAEIYHSVKRLHDVNAAFKKTLGLSMKELSKQWKDYYRKRYLPEVANREDLTNFGDLLTGKDQAGTYNTSPAVSPQGDKVALITNARGYFDVIVISAVTGKKIKTLIKGKNNLNFENFNILKPNLSWSPDGSKVALSAKSEGSDHLAIVDYKTGNTKFIKFPKLDAIGSVAWSPDGKKIAFDGNIGSFPDIYVYNLETKKFSNVTHDVISDANPSWGNDSETLYFSSERGDQLQLNKVKNNSQLLVNNSLYSTDIYAVKLGSSNAIRLTKTPKWNEKEPVTTKDGRLFFISDENGIDNVYEMNLNDRTSLPLTDLQTGVTQMSLSSDGSRMAVTSLNDGAPDIFMIQSPLSRKKDGPLQPNQWAKRRANESEGERVPATKYARQMLLNHQVDSTSLPAKMASMIDTTSTKTVSVGDTTASQQAGNDTTGVAQNKPSKADSNEVDYHNYVFDSSVEQDTTFRKKYLSESKFDMSDNKTKDGRFVPNDYRLKFTPDYISSSGGANFSTYGGAYGLIEGKFSDLLGNYQIVFGTDLQFDLRNSNYYLQFGYLKKRANWIFTYFHNANNFQTYTGALYSLRSYGGSVTMQYPFDKFRRLDVELSVIGLAQNYSQVNVFPYGGASNDTTINRKSTFSYPQITYTSDKSINGYITPVAGSRFAVSLTASPPIPGSLQFESLLGDYRKYFPLGKSGLYSVALRASGGISFGSDSQTFFMGGTQGWINRKWSGNNLPIDRLGDNFFTLPAIPLRGHEYNDIYGDRFTLANAEFRFPLIRALIPGPLPILALYNLTGVAFVDAGMAWGQDIQSTSGLANNAQITNSSKLNFQLQDKNDVDDPTANSNPGDILMGAGFGLRTIIFGLPLRYSIGWPFYKGGFGRDPVNYISIGIDF